MPIHEDDRHPDAALLPLLVLLERDRAVMLAATADHLPIPWRVA